MVSVFLGIALFVASVVSVDQRLAAVVIVGVLAYILSAWVLFEDLKGWEWIALMVRPTTFTIGAGLFANMLPSAIPRFLGLNFPIETSLFLGGVVKVAYMAIYVVGVYAILLTENIFSVASIKSIQLFRAARSVSFIMTLIISLFFFSMMLSLRIPFWSNMLLTSVITFILSFASLWSVDLKSENMPGVVRITIVLTILMGFYGYAVSFWPIKSFMGGLVLTSCFYTLLGILEQRITEKLAPLNYLEFVVFNLIIVFTAFLTTSWVG